MKFKGTIVITDPCYLGEGLPQKQSRKLWDMYLHNEDMSIYGCSQSICDDTLYGDWSCFTYKGTKEEAYNRLREWNCKYQHFFKKCDFEELSAEERSVHVQDFEREQNIYIEKYTLGQFCADTGMVCVVYLDEVLKVNPNFKQWCEEHSWCATVIEDFDGDIRYEIDENGEAHIVGLGNINFYTSQSEY